MASRQEGLGSRSAVMFAAFAIDRLLGFLLIVVITRAWAPAAVGLWTQVVALTGALGTIASMGLYQAHIRFSEESVDPRVRHSLQLTILSVTTGALLLAASVGALASGPVARFVFGGDVTDTRVLAAAFALALSELWTEFVTVQMRAELDARGAARVVAGKAVLRVVIVGSLAVAGIHDVALAVATLATVQALGAVAVMVGRFDGALWLAAGFAPARALARRAMRMALPMVPAALAAQAYVLTERFALARSAPAALPHFNIGQQFASNAMMAYVILGSMFYPMLVRAWRDGKAVTSAPVVTGALMTYLLVSLPALLVLPLVSRELIPSLTTPYYAVNAPGFLALMIGAAGLGVHQLAGYVFYVTERTWELLALLVFSLAVKLALAVLLVARLGERGAVLSWAIAGALLALVTVLRARHLVPFTLPAGRTLRIVGAAILAASIVAAVRFVISEPSPLLVLSTVALALCLYAALMRNELRRAIQVGAPV